MDLREAITSWLESQVHLGITGEPSTGVDNRRFGYWVE